MAGKVLDCERAGLTLVTESQEVILSLVHAAPDAVNDGPREREEFFQVVLNFDKLDPHELNVSLAKEALADCEAACAGPSWCLRAVLPVTLYRCLHRCFVYSERVYTIDGSSSSAQHRTRARLRARARGVCVCVWCVCGGVGCLLYTSDAADE